MNSNNQYLRMNNNLVIAVIGHKEFVCPKDMIYRAVYVGPKNFDTADAYRDDIGDNIAEKNPYYCELTGLYWIWKNEIINYDVVGLCHYRRYFGKIPFLFGESTYLNESKIQSTLSKYDVILPWKAKLKCTVKENYYLHGAGREKDLDLLRNVVAKMYPDYLSSYDEVLSSKEACYCNMFVMDAQKTDEYCKWLFDILFDLEGNIDLSDYSKAEARIYGYLSEILINVWVLKNGLKAKYFPVIHTEQSKLERIKGQINHYRGKC